MQTITFYSYKGGVGRTLAVANVAKYLARFGQKVFLVDFDLEAPGLHYKLALGQTNHKQSIERGVLDYIYSFAIEESIPPSLEHYVVPVDPRSDVGGSIHLMPAGRIPSADYWQRLAQINWHDLFYREGAQGVPFFLEFKERIARDYAPDFLLVDSRTGVTEIGGVATSLWPDRLVCLLLNNLENLEGARAVLRSIQALKRLPSQGEIEILPVLTRIPQMNNTDIEERLAQDVETFLNAEADLLEHTLHVSEVLILHSEPGLQLEEALSIGGKQSPAESPLLRDYLRFFARLIPAEVVKPHIGSLIAEILAQALADPDGAQRDLEALAATCAHPDVYRALLQFYRLRRANKETLLRTAWRYWDMHEDNSDPLLWETVKNSFDVSRPDDDKQVPVPLEFVEGIWRAAGANDIDIALGLAKSYASVDKKEREANVLLTCVASGGVDERIVIRAINCLRKSNRWKDAADLVAKFASEFRDSDAFQVAWARFVVAQGISEQAIAILEQPEFQTDLIKKGDLITWVDLLRLAGHEEAVNEELQMMLRHELRRVHATGEATRTLADIGKIYSSLDHGVEFVEKVRQMLGEKANQVLRFLDRPHYLK